jgi:hypothetical protein
MTIKTEAAGTQSIASVELQCWRYYDQQPAAEQKDETRIGPERLMDKR